MLAMTASATSTTSLPTEHTAHQFYAAARAQLFLPSHTMMSSHRKGEVGEQVWQAVLDILEQHYRHSDSM